MEQEQAKTIVERIQTDVSGKFTGPPMYRDSYILGGVLARIEFMLMISNLKFKDFDERGNYKLPFERDK